MRCQKVDTFMKTQALKGIKKTRKEESERLTRRGYDILEAKRLSDLFVAAQFTNIAS